MRCPISPVKPRQKPCSYRSAEALRRPNQVHGSLRCATHQLCQRTNPASCEPYFYVGAFVQMDALNESHASGLQSKDYGGGSCAFTEEADAF